MVKEGLAFGSGQAIAHRVVSHMFGPSQQQQPQIQVPTEYIQCMKESKGDAEACKYLLG
jgi:hypothetical protein